MSEEIVNKHIAEVHGEKNPFLEVKKSVKDVNNHISNVHEVKKPYACKICKLRFAKIEEISDHMASNHESNNDSEIKLQEKLKIEPIEIGKIKSEPLKQLISSPIDNKRQKLGNYSDIQTQKISNIDKGSKNNVTNIKNIKIERQEEPYELMINSNLDKNSQSKSHRETTKNEIKSKNNEEDLKLNISKNKLSKMKEIKKEKHLKSITNNKIGEKGSKELSKNPGFSKDFLAEYNKCFTDNTNDTRIPDNLKPKDIAEKALVPREVLIPLQIATKLSITKSESIFEN